MPIDERAYITACEQRNAPCNYPWLREIIKAYEAAKVAEQLDEHTIIEHIWRLFDQLQASTIDNCSPQSEASARQKAKKVYERLLPFLRVPEQEPHQPDDCFSAFKANYNAAWEEADFATFDGKMFHIPPSDDYEDRFEMNKEINKEWIAFQKGWKARQPKRESSNRLTILASASWEEIESPAWDGEGDKPIIMQLRDNLAEWADIAKDRAASIDKFRTELEELRRRP